MSVSCEVSGDASDAKRYMFSINGCLRLDSSRSSQAQCMQWYCREKWEAIMRNHHSHVEDMSIERQLRLFPWQPVVLWKQITIKQQHPFWIVWSPPTFSMLCCGGRRAQRFHQWLCSSKQQRIRINFLGSKVSWVGEASVKTIVLVLVCELSLYVI